MRIDSSFSWLGVPFSLLLACSAASDSGLEAETETGDGDPDTRLFDETGVWALEQYTLDGGPYLEIAQNRKDRFLLRFKPADGVVAAAACHEQNTNVDVDASNCTNAALSSWTCQCFAYTYDNSQMRWQEFEPYNIPPPVGPDAHQLFVAIDPGGTSSRYEFSPLPQALFNSDGDVSKYIFEHKLDALWTEVDINQDGMIDLEACATSCFPSGAL